MSTRQLLLTDLILKTDAFEPSKQGLAAITLMREQMTMTNADVVIPIESFKSKHNTNLHPPSHNTIFYSSGTLGDRSEVHFGKADLERYEIQSLWTFCATLRRLHLDPLKTQGFCCIPQISQWPHSSLAHMLSCFAKHLPMYFVEQNDLEEQLNAHIRTSPKRPVWIFATASQYWNMRQEKGLAALPEGSVLFETGGHKSATENWTRDELYQHIESLFSVTSDSIASEYGMSELACQAYDFVGPTTRSARPRNLANRRFRFPFWVNLSVTKPLNKKAKSGFGCLCVRDTLREYPAGSIRTQDLVNLDEDLTFVLSGRVPASSIKGCSTHFATQVAPSISIPNQGKPSEGSKIVTHPLVSLQMLHERASLLLPAIEKWLENPRTLELLTNEFGCQTVSRWAVHELKTSINLTIDDVIQNALKSLGSKDKSESHWLIILPQNHSIAGLHHLFYAALLNLHCTVRVPHRLQKSLVTSFIELCGHTISWKPELADESLRLGAENPFQGPIVVFGTTSTIDTMSTLHPNLVAGFGSVTTGLLLSAQDLDHMEKLVHDVMESIFALAGRGCLAVRGIIFADSGSSTPPIELVEKLQQALWSQSKQLNMTAMIDESIQIGIDHYREKQALMNAIQHDRHTINQGEFPVYYQPCEGVVSPFPTVCPIWHTNQTIHESMEMAKTKGFSRFVVAGHSLTKKLDFSNPNVHRLGAPVFWNGCHLGKHLFATGR